LLVIAAGMGPIAFGVPAQAAPPEPVTFTLDIPAGAPLGSCAFDVTAVATGKVKTIETPTGKTIGISANFTVTATGNGQTAEYKVNGSFMQTTGTDGNVTTKATGRNFLTDPDAGVVVTSGNFTFTFDAQGNLVEGLSGNGRIIDVCADLS
jgi:hypothetical protein